MKLSVFVSRALRSDGLVAKPRLASAIEVAVTRQPSEAMVSADLPSLSWPQRLSFCKKAARSGKAKLPLGMGVILARAIPAWLFPPLGGGGKGVDPQEISKRAALIIIPILNMALALAIRG